MTLQEKLAAMELLWEDLARSPESIESPTWHKDILDERRQRIAEGKSQFVDWETGRMAGDTASGADAAAGDIARVTQKSRCHPNCGVAQKI